MITLLTSLGILVAEGVAGNAARDLIKRVWGELTKRDLEDVYLDSFETAIKELRPKLEIYTDGYVEISREELGRVLHQKLFIPIENVSLSELSSSDFIELLAETLASEETVILSGHTLSKQDYLSLIRQVVRLATGTFRAEVEKNPVFFQKMIIREALNLQQDFREIQSILAKRFDITFAQLDEILNIVNNTSEVTLQIKDDTSTIIEGIGSLQFSLAAIIAQIGPELPGSNQENDEQNYHTRIDFAVELLKGGKPKTALEWLSRLNTDLEEKKFPNW